VHRLGVADGGEERFEGGGGDGVSADVVRTDTPVSPVHGAGREGDREGVVLDDPLAPLGVADPGEQPVPVLGEPGRVAGLPDDPRPQFQGEVRGAAEVGVEAEADRVRGRRVVEDERVRGCGP
jgi:hypothetical protein